MKAAECDKKCMWSRKKRQESVSQSSSSEQKLFTVRVSIQVILIMTRP